MLKLNSLIKILAGVILSLTVSQLMTEPIQARNNKARFYCGYYNGQRATYMETPRKKNLPLIVWVVDFSGYPKEVRCEEVSQRFQAYNANGKLKFIRTGLINNLPVICVANQKGGKCPNNQVLITLKPGVNAQNILRQLTSIRPQGSAKPIPLRVGTFFYTDGELYVDMDKFIDSLDSELEITTPSTQP